MIYEELVDEYYEWLCRLVYNDAHDCPDMYQDRIYSYLNGRVFEWSVEDDVNRALAGRDLRKYFLYEYGMEDDTEFEYIIDDVWGTDDSCSVLECLIGIAKEWEDELAFDPRFGDRTAHWFWDHMMYNLGLYNGFITDKGIERIIDIWLYREYDRYGNGNIFTIPNFTHGFLNDNSIWYQLCAYINYKESNGDMDY